MKTDKSSEKKRDVDVSPNLGLVSLGPVFGANPDVTARVLRRAVRRVATETEQINKHYAMPGCNMRKAVTW